jgi:hypothetical protein
MSGLAFNLPCNATAAARFASFISSTSVKIYSPGVILSVPNSS